MKAGQLVQYTDEDGDTHTASITAIHGDAPGPRTLDLSYDVGMGQGDGSSSTLTAEKVPHVSTVRQLKDELDEEAKPTPEPPFWFL